MGRIVGIVALVGALVGIARAGVDVNINIGVPPPPAVVLPAPPRLVVVPTTPAVMYAPDVDFNVFFYSGRYWTFSNGNWFWAVGHGGPWTYCERVHVPRQVLVVPYRYYRMPPGHVRHVDWDEHHGNPHGMPPGQAKKYYGDRHEHGHGHHGHDED